jgi:hypothetical protein
VCSISHILKQLFTFHPMRQKNIIQIVVYLFVIFIFLIWIYTSMKYRFDNSNLLIMSGLLLFMNILYQFITFVTHCWKKDKHEIGVSLLHLLIIITLLYVQLGSFFSSISSSVGEPPKYPLQ